MLFGKGGQNFVQASNNNGGAVQALGGIVNQFMRDKVKHAMRKDLITHQTNEKIRGNMIEAAASPLIMGHYFDYANQGHGEDHPNVVNKVTNPETGNPYKASDPIRPAFAHFVNNFGIQSGKYGIMPGAPSKGAEQEKARQARLEKFPQSSVGSRTKHMAEGAGEGRDANFKDTQAAHKAGYITAEQASDLNPKFKQQYSDYKAKNPGYKGSSEAKINSVNSTVNSMETK